MAPNMSRSFKGNILANGDYNEGEYKRRNLGTMLALAGRQETQERRLLWVGVEQPGPDAGPFKQHRASEGRLTFARHGLL